MKHRTTTTATKPIIKLTAKQRNHARRLKRKAGPAGQRRAQQRSERFPVEACGCRHTSVGLKRCVDHQHALHTDHVATITHVTLPSTEE